MVNIRFKRWVSSIVTLSIGLILTAPASACTRALYNNPSSKYVVTGRNMDWFESLDASLWVFPKGIKRHGSAGQNSLNWTSKYGSVVITAFDKAVADGMNEKGLAVNALYLGETNFGARNVANPAISWAAYVQYLLDNYGSVSEAVASMQTLKLEVVSSPIPGSTPKPPTLHFALSDATGDSAIFEYLEGKLVIHHGKQYTIMTNSPIYSDQLALNTYWQSVGGEHMLPGTVRASDRYVRASYYINQLPVPNHSIDAVTAVMSVMNNTAQPAATINPEVPNISPTIWQTLANNTNKVYYFKGSNLPSAVWINFKDLNVANGAPTLKVRLQNNMQLSGSLKNNLVKAPPLVFTGPQDK